MALVLAESSSFGGLKKGWVGAREGGRDWRAGRKRAHTGTAIVVLSNLCWDP